MAAQVRVDDVSTSRRVALLMTATTYRASAFLDAARRLGADVVIGSDRAQTLAFANPDGHLMLDFQDVDAGAGCLVEFGQRRALDAVVATDDEGVVLAATAAARLGLRTSPVAAISAARNKLRMREVLARAGLPGPGFRAVALDQDPGAIARQVCYPCVLKPLGLAASRGVMRANDREQFAQAFHLIARLVRGAGGPATLLVEDYMPGPEVALEGHLRAGRLRTLALFDKPDPLEGPFFEESIYVTPSRLDDAVQASVREVTAQSARALGLTEGPVHAELRVGGGRVGLIEIAPRSIGGLCSQALRFGDGVSLEELILREALGIGTDALERESSASGVMMIPILRSGTLHGVSGVEAARAVRGVEGVRITIPVGQPVVPLPVGSRYLGFIFARAERAGDVEQSLREANACLSFDIQQQSVARERVPDTGQP